MSDTTTLPESAREDISDGSCRAWEAQSVVLDAADRRGDDHLYLAARALDQLA